ncbi:zinc finger protein 143-like isoform X2 [Gigantopelta aegis]|uniref:zinc finger protein 143-like isoform X2 n=1 Tax=Gigantopelta aegis TaxID=1735272 RepID=UPI001B888C81|nr:zinc finger protein 143-like isoform X2 [Gigantopelta aegis]
MSPKGGHTKGKDGGAHRATHESQNESVISSNNVDIVRLTQESICIQDEIHRNFQDGDDRSDENNRAANNLQLLPADSDSESSELDSYSYERAVVENNAEWLKSRCRNIGTIDFEICNGGNSDNYFEAENGIAVSLCSGNGGREFGSQQMDTAVGDSNPIVIYPMEETNESNVDPSCDGEGVQIHLSEFQSDEMQDNLQILELHGFDKNEAIALMSPDELESLPSSGLEFNDTGVVESANVSSLKGQKLEKIQSLQIVENKQPPTKEIDLDTVTKTLDNSELSEHFVKPEGPAVSSGTYLVSAPVTQTPSSSSDSSTNAAMPNLTLATISISTDKVANSTQILVNTTQGQQLYLINTADLNQATNALQPLAHPQSTLNSTVQLEKTLGVDVQQAAQSQLQGSGYLLVPVQGDNSGIIIYPNEDSEDSSRKSWVCTEPGCNKVFSKLCKLKVHEMRHTGERPFKCSRVGCDWAFTTAYKLKRHEESHEGRKNYYCDFEGCGRKFTTVYNMNSHRKLHERPCTELCSEPGCNERFPTKRQLDLHMRSHPETEKTYKCPVEGCDKVFFSSNCMGSHARVHLQDREDLTCNYDGCGKVFDKLCRLKQHQRKHTGEKPYPCSYEGCTWAFATASKLKRHMAKHTGIRKWVCQLCNKGFMRAEHLKGHMVTHSGMKPFVCPVEGCKSRFAAKSSLYVHLKRHEQSDKEITYHCPMEGCMRTYTCKANLRNHIIKHYLEAPSGTETRHLVLVPLLNGDDDAALEDMDDVNETTDVSMSVESLESVITGEDTSLTTSAPQDISLVTTAAQENILTTVARDTTSPDFVHADNSLINLDEGEELESEHLAGNVILQLTSPIQQHATQPKTTASADKDHSGKSGSSGSARTDFHSNRRLSDRARKRWQMIQEGIAQQQTTSGNNDVIADDNGMLVTPSTTTRQTFNPPELLSSQGLMFKDPETGITYVQTQLLQDDPPHPDLYSDGSANLDSEVTQAEEFSGTTINLQDLE